MSEKLVGSKTEYDADAKIWRGPQMPDRYEPDTPLGRILIESLLEEPEHVAQICYHNGKEYTNQMIAQLALNVAHNLQTKLGLRQKDVIGLLASNSDYVAPLVMGALAVGVTVSTLDPSFNQDEVLHIFGITQPKVLFCDGSNYTMVKKAFAGTDLSEFIYTLNHHPKDSCRHVEELLSSSSDNKEEFVFPKLEDGVNQVAMILCSSGTTGLPKGVCVSHYSLLNMPVMSLDRNDKLLCFSTLYWLSGLLCLLAGTICNATRVITEQRYSPTTFFDMVKRYRVNVLFTPPSIMALSLLSPEIESSDLSSIKLYICGGSSVPYSLYCKFRKYIPNAQFIVGYGMTEISGPASTGEIFANCASGQLAPHIELKVIDDSGKQLGPNGTGEICLRTRFPWAGYCRNPKATQEIYDREHWVHSGDIGYMSEEGILYVIDRKKDIYKYNNFHFSPSEIESVINEIPGVSEATVVGIPDEISSFLPAVAIVKMPGAVLSEQAVLDYVAGKLVDHKHIRGGVYFFTELPKTPSGKNIRRKVLEMCLKRRQEQQG